MSRSTTLVGVGLLTGTLLVVHPVSGSAQDLPLTLMIPSDDKVFQQALDRAAADGYRLVGGHAGLELALLARADDGVKRSYVFAPHVEKFLKEQKLQPGYRLLPEMFGGDFVGFGAVFERADGDDRPRVYRFVKAGSIGAIRKKLVQEGAARGATVVAVAASAAGVAVMLEELPDAPGVVAVASGGIDEISREISSAGTKGLCVVDGDGIKSPLFVLQGCPSGRSAPEYEVLSTTRTETFEKELNAVAAKGQRLVPLSFMESRRGY